MRQPAQERVAATLKAIIESQFALAKKEAEGWGLIHHFLKADIVSCFDTMKVLPTMPLF